MGVIGVEKELFEHLADEVRVDSDEATGVCGGGVLEKFGEVLILGS